ncbi:MAG: NAD(P)-dependent alcohol dehydrogenase [Sandaracinus sp.]|nr:NAD(P)-dependent alcohol dehydrogenase [Sandaracinus sp.]|tara:strand:- start:2704 stop:3708 length:1005 start_codon:yes stop_codon:yes gene_type:complete
MSRQWQLREAFGLDNLELRTGEPTAGPGRGQIAVRIRACSLNYRDLLIVRGEYDPRMKVPFVPLSDGAGEVVAVGEGVDEWKVGDRVLGCFAPRWQGGEATKERLRYARGTPTAGGMLAELVVADADGWVPTPDHLSDEQAATLPCAAVTAWNALEGVRAGQTVLVQGTGGVAIAALQLAQLKGARVIVTSSQQAKRERAEGLGAWKTLDYTEDTEWGKTVAGLGGADRVIEVGGAGTVNQSLRAVRVGGQVAIIGILAGVKADIALTKVLMNGVSLRGIMVGSREDFLQMNRAIAAHEMEPVVDRVFAMDEVPDAFAYLARGAHFGKVCIRVS